MNKYFRISGKGINRKMVVSGMDIERKLKEKLLAVKVNILYVSGGCGNSFEAVIISGEFEGKQILTRHRLVNSVLKDEISQIHAFTQKWCRIS